MVIGFEELTAHLSEEEIKVAKALAIKLASLKGPEQAMNNRQLRDYLWEIGVYTSAVRIRRMINYIRVHGLVSNVIASSHGYYVARDWEEVERYVASLRQRASAILAVAQSYY
jgi:hypothetical protein